MIRRFEEKDNADVVRIHEQNGLDPACLPDLYIEDEPNALYVVKAVKEVAGEPVMMSFLKVRSELYVLVDHEKGTPEERWEWMKELKEYMVREARIRGLDQMTAFIPPELEESFSKRLAEMGFIKGPWASYSLNIAE